VALLESAQEPSILNNPGWHALNTHHGQFATGTGLAKRYSPEVAPYAAVVDHGKAAIDDLARIVANDRAIRLMERRVPPEIPGWTLSQLYPLDQMVCSQPAAESRSDVPFLVLSEADVSDMLRLVELSRPGPFFPRTIELGHYIGIRHEGELVAMAGERFHLTGYREISAICTAPEHQGKGYARLLTGHLISEILRRGSIPFLHVRADNTPAVRLYESLHFRKRAELHVGVFTR
jgi:predicted GNAT family acetyltransferase